jgi:hypothetical protein
MHAFSVLNGIYFADNSPIPNVGPVLSLHLIASDGSIHGKDVSEVKLKSIAPKSLFDSEYSDSFE